MKDFRKKSFMSIVMNLAPFADWEIVLLRSNFVSIKLAAGEDASYSYCSLSPPTVRRTLYCSDFSGLKSHIKLAYVTIAFAGTSHRGI